MKINFVRGDPTQFGFSDSFFQDDDGNVKISDGVKLNFEKGTDTVFGFSETVLQDGNSEIELPQVNDKIKLCYLNGQMFNIDFSEIKVLKPVPNYEELNHKPQINSVELIGNVSAQALGLGEVYYDTTANWNAQSSMITKAGVVYIYSDATSIEDEYGNVTPVASIKVGDGTSYLMDMPFITSGSSSVIMEHLANGVIHISELDREFWDNKVSAYLDGNDLENLVLSKVNYVVDGDVMIS